MSVSVCCVVTEIPKAEAEARQVLRVCWEPGDMSWGWAIPGDSWVVGSTTEPEHSLSASQPLPPSCSEEPRALPTH